MHPNPVTGRIQPVEISRMSSNYTNRTKTTLANLAVVLALASGAVQAIAQAAPRFIGAITAISGSTITVKTDQGEVHRVEVPSTASIKRIAPGQKDLSTAETIQFADLAIGDRALVKLDPDAPAGAQQALQIVAIKQADVALKQQKDREDWQHRGVGGLVKSVDAGLGDILLTTGAGATAKTITVHTSKATMLKRYAPASVRFDDAQPAPLDAIHAGDQLRARGTKSADGGAIAAEEVVSGTFRNIAGTVVSLDAATSTLVVKDLATKKQVAIHVAPDAQMRKLPERMAQMLALRLKGEASAAGSNMGGSQPQGVGAVATQRGGGGQWGPGAPGAPQMNGGDPQQMLSRAPAIQLADLNKGDAVMLVCADGANEVDAITLLAGVEPLLEAPAASQSLLANWSMSGAGSADSAQ